VCAPPHQDATILEAGPTRLVTSEAAGHLVSESLLARGPTSARAVETPGGGRVRVVGYNMRKPSCWTKSAKSLVLSVANGTS
jgi:hypothetical protein